MAKNGRKVLFVSETQGWSGGAKQLLSLAEGLNRSGWRVLLACPGDGEAFARARAAGIDVVDIHPRQDYDLVSALQLRAIAAANNVDVIHAHHPRAHAVSLIAAHLYKRPVFVVTRRVSFPIPDRVFSRMKYLSPRIDGYVAVSESIRSVLLEAGVAADRVAMIPSAVDLEAFRPRARDAGLAAELKLPEGVPVVGHVANYGSWKGQDVSVAAAAELKKSGAKTIFLFAGRDTDGPDLAAKARAAGLAAEDVRFIGFFKDVPRLLSLVDVSVNASTAGEGLSGALRESLAMEVPVVASDFGGNKELVADGRTGRLFRSGDARDFARVLQVTLDDLPAAKAMARVGRADVQARFSAERMAPAVIELYQRLLAKRAAGRSCRFTPKA